MEPLNNITAPVLFYRTGLDVDDLENDDDLDALEDDNELESGKRENTREGKFMLYWRTEAKTSTTTTYTGTTTISALECTPSDFEMRSC